MKRSNVLVILLMLSMLACAIPGLSTQPPVQASDPNALSTMIAGTAQMLAQQTANAYIGSTPVLAPTSTSTPTQAPNNTAAPQISAEGTSLSKQGDGSVIFTDQKAGYSFIFPSGWLVVRINEQEYLNAWALPEAANPLIQNFLTKAQSSDPKVFRVLGANIQPELVQKVYLTNFSIVWDDTVNDPLEDTVQALKKQLPQTLLNPDITDTDVGVTSSQIPIGTLVAESSVPLTTGDTFKLYQKQYIFRLQQGTIVLTISTTLDLKDQIIPILDQTADQVQMLQ